MADETPDKKSSNPDKKNGKKLAKKTPKAAGKKVAKAAAKKAPKKSRAKKADTKAEAKAKAPAKKAAPAPASPQVVRASARYVRIAHHDSALGQAARGVRPEVPECRRIGFLRLCVEADDFVRSRLVRTGIRSTGDDHRPRIRGGGCARRDEAARAGEDCGRTNEMLHAR